MAGVREGAGPSQGGLSRAFGFEPKVIESHWRFGAVGTCDLVFYLLFCGFFNIYFEKERERAQAGVCRERGRQRSQSRLRAVSAEPYVGLELTNRDIMT